MYKRQHISSPKVNLLRKDGLVGKFTNPITGEKNESVGSAFVDDVNMYSTGEVGSSLEDLMSEADTHVYAWSKLLRVWGGCASASKSFWYALEQECVNGIWHWKDTQGHEIEIEGDHGEVSKIKSLPLDEERKFLGVFDSPEGGNREQIKK